VQNTVVIERIIKDLRAHLVSKSVNLKVGVQISVELMGEVAAQETKSKRGPKSKFELQIEQVHKLPRTKQKFVSEMLETVIQQAAH